MDQFPVGTWWCTLTGTYNVYSSRWSIVVVGVCCWFIVHLKFVWSCSHLDFPNALLSCFCVSTDLTSLACLMWLWILLLIRFVTDCLQKFAGSALPRLLWTLPTSQISVNSNAVTNLIRNSIVVHVQCTWNKTTLRFGPGVDRQFVVQRPWSSHSQGICFYD